jgi:hypothetical protein
MIIAIQIQTCICAEKDQKASRRDDRAARNDKDRRLVPCVNDPVTHIGWLVAEVIEFDPLIVGILMLVLVPVHNFGAR